MSIRFDYRSMDYDELKEHLNEHQIIKEDMLTEVKDHKKFKLLVDTLNIPKELFDKKLHEITFQDGLNGWYLLQKYPEYLNQKVIDDLYNFIAWYILRWSECEDITIEYLREYPRWLKLLIYLKKKGAIIKKDLFYEKVDDLDNLIKEITKFN